MGIVLCEKAWYNDHCRAHLNDTSKFVPVTAADAAAACEACLQQLREWLEHHAILLTKAFGATLGENILHFLHDVRDYELPVFYGITKLHKPTRALRPIVAAHSWVTSPFAHVAAENLQPDVERFFPHVLSSTPELVRAIEALRFSRHQVDTTFLITGDVEGLYANIQQDQALDTVGGHLTNILQGGQLNAPLRAEVLRFAMQFVFKKAYMRFGTDVYKQLNGIPMG